MKAISTKILPATDTLPTRIKAFDGDGNNLTMTYNTRDRAEDCHKAVAIALLKKLNWGSDRWQGGHTKNGMVFVREDEQNAFTIA